MNKKNYKQGELFETFNLGKVSIINQGAKTIPETLGLTDDDLATGSFKVMQALRTTNGSVTGAVFKALNDGFIDARHIMCFAIIQNNAIIRGFADQMENEAENARRN